MNFCLLFTNQVVAAALPNTVSWLVQLWTLFESTDPINSWMVLKIRVNLSYLILLLGLIQYSTSYLLFHLNFF